MPLVKLQNVHWKLDGTPILNNICFELEQGERLVVLGQSGAGKTSMLRVLAGLIEPTQGEVSFNGQLLKRIPPHHRRIALLSQDYALYPQLTIQQNLEISLKRLKLGRAQIRTAIDEVSTLFEISELLPRLPSEISGGQAQRAAFAKALVKQPELLLLDEPLSQLDARLRQHLMRIIIDQAEKKQITICWVAHDLWEAFQVASRIMVIRSGRILQDGSPSEIYHCPKSSLVSELCSPWGINWLPLDMPELEAVCRWAPAEAGHIGIRPEDCQLDGDGQLLPLSVQVERVQFVGFATLVHAKAGKKPFTFLDRSQRLATPGPVRVFVDPAKLLWKPSETRDVQDAAQGYPLLPSPVNSATDH